MNTEFEKVVQNWISQAMSGLGQLPEGVSKSEWVARNVAKWLRDKIDNDFSEVEGTAKALRQHAEQLGGWKKKELGELMHEMTHLDENLAQLRKTLGTVSADNMKNSELSASSVAADASPAERQSLCSDRMMMIQPILASEFYHDGRGPELVRVHWKHDGKMLSGFEYYNPDDKYEPEQLKHLILDRVEAFAMSSDEVHGNILAQRDSKAAIFKVIDSPWKKSFQQQHLEDCAHYQIIFYDEIYDVICRTVIAGKGNMPEESAQLRASAGTNNTAPAER